MTVLSALRIADRRLVAGGRTVLTGVPDAVTASYPAVDGSVDGVFLGADLAAPAARHVVPIGTLRGARFMACFRFKLWWMAQKMGDKGREIPLETQFLLVESSSSGDGAGEGGEAVYIVFLPLVDGAFRTSLQGGAGDELELCIESGDAGTRSATFPYAVFVGAAESDPFVAISGAVAAVKAHLRTFHTRAEKRLPGIADVFGWCTWDAFYQDVTAAGVDAGLRSLAAGGAPPKFVIIDDGWQSVDDNRLTGITSNSKFHSMKAVVQAAKQNYGVKYVYVWHAITGYWGGVRPGVAGYNSELKYPDISAGVSGNDPGMASDPLTVRGVGLVDPRNAYTFYDELHSYLAGAGVDGVKVDVQSILETLGGGLGGRVKLAGEFHRALDASVAKNFPDNGVIACMSHSSDALYCARQTAVVRASDDFYPRDPASHTIHIAAVAYNSVFLGEFMLPDWDMFHSLHPAAEYHASARAISGGPVYVSDAPGKHDFALLRKLVLPDGSVLRARLPGRPTRDCLFSDPTRDGKSLLKIWNMNKFTGVLGVYNCQGAAWSAVEKKNAFHDTGAEALTGTVRSRDVHLIAEAATDADWGGDCAVYSHRAGALAVLRHGEGLPVSLKVLEHEILTVSPIKDLAPGHRFAPLGLIDMFNGGGAVEGLSYHLIAGVTENGSMPNGGTGAVGMACIEVRGCGRFGAYSSAKPIRCIVGSEDVGFSYDAGRGLLELRLDGMPAEWVHKLVVEL